ncbi:ABC transporter permease [Actinocatenispora rupis]|uniref:Xylose transport system permease protein XylH n=1 Tax=Actinocatenispora rupis TaxID=519421 RepID=A0A8J3J5R3_9ACTN|nr:ABC transporter permease [Actinocatenispora rupis]GID12106.1 sugar ABC transporter permease [Actinocatenispora rupis]
MSAPAVPDERVAAVSPVRRLLVRPELGALIGAVVVFVFFALLSSTFRSADGVANWLDPASTLGIMAVAVALLMIGGEFDLSAGVLTGTTGLAVTILATRFGLNVWLAVLLSLVLALAVGLANGYVVTRTKLPSFIVTLGMFLVLQGLNLGVTKLLTGNVLVGGLVGRSGFDSAHLVFASSVVLGGTYFKVSIVWWLVLTVLATLVLLRTRFGNWVFAVGGDANAARKVGVPATRTSMALFATTATAAWLVGTITALRNTSAQADAGVGDELTFIVAAVIGGCLLTGGFGSAVGASLGALIFGMTSVGIVYAGWDADWYKLFLGAMLLLAVFANQFVRRYAERRRRS